jgi:4-amino-4-deoxy-L-arabinose transferase-like glycosyltransferase
MTGLRLGYIGHNELSPDEAYYHEWSQRLDWCYFSKGPGIAATMKASTAMFGHGEFGIRFFAPILALGTSLLLYWLARRIFDARVAFWTVVLMNVTPIFNAGGLVMTIDPLSIFFWTAAVCTTWLALEKSPAFTLWWPATGLLIGLGWLCKFTNAMQLASIFLLLLLTPKYRRDLIRPGFISMLAVFLPFVWPIYKWNAEHGYPTTSHLAARGGLDTAWWQLDFPSFFQFFGSHFGVYSPLIFAALLWTFCAFCKDSLARWCGAAVWAAPAIPASFKSRTALWAVAILTLLALFFAGNALEMPELHKLAAWLALAAALAAIATLKDEPNMMWKPRFLLAFSAPLVAMYIWIALHHDAEVNWTAPATVTLAILTVSYFIERVTAGGVWRKLAIAAIALGAVLSILIVNTNILRAVGIPLPFKRDPSARLRGWSATAKAVADFRKKIEDHSGRKVFLIADDYGTAASLCYYMPDKVIEAPGHPPVYVPESPAAENQFHFWGRYDEYEARNASVPINEDEDSKEYGINKFAGRSALYITDRAEGEPATVLIRSFYKKPNSEADWTKQKNAPWRKFTEIEINQDGLPLRKLRIFVLPHYMPGKVLD